MTAGNRSVGNEKVVGADEITSWSSAIKFCRAAVGAATLKRAKPHGHVFQSVTIEVSEGDFHVTSVGEPFAKAQPAKPRNGEFAVAAILQVSKLNKAARK